MAGVIELDRSSTSTNTTSRRAAVLREVTVPLEKPSIRMNSKGTFTLAASDTVRCAFASSWWITTQVPELEYVILGSRTCRSPRGGTRWILSNCCR